MAWNSDATGFSPPFTLQWKYAATTPSGIPGFYRDNVSQMLYRKLWYSDAPKKFKSTKSYIYQTVVSNFTQDWNTSNNYFGATLSITAPWGSYFTYSAKLRKNLGGFIEEDPANIRTPIDTDAHVLYFISSPSSDTTSTKWVEYKATRDGFYNDSSSSSDKKAYLHSFNVYESDWKFKGHAYAAKLTEINGAAANSVVVNNSPFAGWRYNVSNSSLTFVHPEYNISSGGFVNIYNGPATTGGKKRRNSLDGDPIINYAARYVSYETFNLKFEYVEPISSTYSFVNVWLTRNLPSTSSYSSFLSDLRTGQFLGRISTTGTYSYYGLGGGKNVIFVASNTFRSGVTTEKFSFDISNIEIDGSYSEPDNNVERLFTNSENYSEPTTLQVLNTSNGVDFSYTSITQQTQHLTDGLTGVIANGATGATGTGLNFYSPYFSNLYGTVSNLKIVNSKVGNGKFKAGIWENGVWNNGIRIDENAWDFDDIVVAFNLSTQNIKWRFQLSGNEDSVSNFEIGDKVSIGNVVGIDINEKRKLFKNYFTIIKKDETNIVVEIENAFPIRRIEKDSPNHKIKVTKNVWLNGAFLNGYWENGVWNDGMFKGYPIITEIYNSHWIDGKFDGGHFYGYNPEFEFADTYYLDGFVGLTFSNGHQFVKGDLIKIDKDDKSLNPQYDGNWTVTEVLDDYLIKTDLTWGISSTNESGKVYRRTNTSLIQNFEFIDNNVAKYNYLTVKGGQSVFTYSTSDIDKIWNYNSWMELTYSTQSFTTLGKDKTSFDPEIEDIDAFGEFLTGNFGIGEYSETNLRGGITNDILSSKSLFRDVDSQIRRYYSLGTKHEIYNDYIGDGSNFDLPFNSKPSLGGLSNFISDGWTYSLSKTYAGWNSQIEFVDNFYNAGKVSFASLEYANVQVGDHIYILQYPGASYPEYDGNHVVTKIIATNSEFPSPSAAIPAYTDYYIYCVDEGFLGSTPPEGGIMRYGRRGEIAVTISRTDDATLKIEQPNDNLQSLILNNTKIDIPKRRYSLIEFNTVTFSNAIFPPITDPAEKIYVPASSPRIAIFPDQNTFDTRNSIKYSFKNYYYNRPKLSLLFSSLGGVSFYALTASVIPGYVLKPTIWTSYGNQSVEIDKLKFYEIDAVPFFKYTTEDFINKSVQVPYIGVAPTIDYTDENFSFIESIKIGLDSVELNTTNYVASPIQTATPSSSISFETE